MRNNKRILAFFVAVMLTFSTLVISASAKTTLDDKELMDVKTFRLLEDEAKLEKEISRAEFARLTVRLTNREQFAYAMGTTDAFSDVPASHWANIYVGLLRSLKIISGDGSTCFYPERAITYNEALKILVGALGYDLYAQNEGGYPFGYNAVAMRLGMTKGVSCGDTLTYADAMQMFYNCLDIGYMEQETITGQEEYYISNISPRDNLMGNSNVGMVKLTGIIQANYQSYLNSPISNIKEDEILFYDILMKTGTSGVENYLGQEVDVYVSTNNDGRYTVETVLPTRNNEITTIDFNDVSSLTENKICYTLDNKNCDLDIEDTAIILYNGRKTDFATAVKYMDNGSVTLISNDGDKDIDVIFVENYISAVVESINYGAQYFVLGGSKRVNGEKAIRYDNSDEDLQIYFLDANGNKIKPEEIEKDEVVSIIADLSGKLIFVKKGNGSITGVISTVSYDDVTYVTINGSEYAVEKGVSDEIRAGINVEAFLNFENKVARLKDASDSVLYGAIVKTGKKGMGNTQIKVLLPGPIADESEEAEDPDEDENILLAAKNSSVAVFTLADKVKYCGTKIPEEEVKAALDPIISSSALKAAIISYKLNSDGEVSSIDVPQEIGAANKKVYNSTERTFGKTTGGAFGVCDETIAICVPENYAQADDEDYLTKIKLSDARSYYVSAYEYNDETHCADLIVVREKMVYQTTGSISVANKIGLVDKVLSKRDDDGEFVQTVSLITQDGKIETLISADTTSSFNFASLKSGDFIYYSLDSLDRIDGAKLIVHSSPIPDSKIVMGDFDTYIGQISDVEYDVVSETLNRWVDIVTFTTDDARVKSFEVRKRNSPPVYVYDSETKSAIQGTSLDCMRSHSRAVICSVGTTVKAILIII